MKKDGKKMWIIEQERTSEASKATDDTRERSERPIDGIEVNLLILGYFGQVSD